MIKKMTETIFQKHIAAFESEAKMLLRFQLASNRIFNLDDTNKISRSDFVDRIISLKAIENDILIRICKFDDKRKNTHSFHNALKTIDKKYPNRKKLIREINMFSALINEIKQKRRHEQLAHLSFGQIDNQYHPKYNFIETIKLIIEIIDIMSQKRINYLWKDGSYEKLDLRNEILYNK